jgi:hypothetical protein
MEDRNMKRIRKRKIILLILITFIVIGGAYVIITTHKKNIISSMSSTQMIDEYISDTFREDEMKRRIFEMNEQAIFDCKINSLIIE